MTADLYCVMGNPVAHSRSPWIHRRFAALTGQALDYDLMRRFYPFCRLSGPANVLIMPALHTADIGAKLLQKMGGTVIGPIVMGLSKPAQIVPMGATVSDVVTAAALAAHDASTW